MNFICLIDGKEASLDTIQDIRLKSQFSSGINNFKNRMNVKIDDKQTMNVITYIENNTIRYRITLNG